MTSMRQDLQEVLLTEEQIQHRIEELAAEIQRDYANKDLTLVAILTGSVMFIADLLRRLPMQLRLDYIGVSSYDGRRSACLYNAEWNRGGQPTLHRRTYGSVALQKPNEGLRFGGTGVIAKSA